MARSRVLVVALLALVVAGCRVDVDVVVDVEDDGSGRLIAEVVLDEEAAEQVPGLADQLAVDDLVAAGWDVSGPTATAEGGMVVRAVAPFASTAEADRRMEQLSGDDGPFRGFSLEREAGTWRTRYRFRGRVDLTAGLEGFGDEGLRERLDGSSLGHTPEELERLAGAALDQVFRFRVVARLPGDVRSNAPTAIGGGAVWRPSLGEDVVLEARSDVLDGARIAWASGAAVAALALLVVLVVRAVRGRRRAPTEAAASEPVP